MLLSQPSRLSVFVLLSRPSCPSASCCCRGLRVARVLQPSSGSHSRNLCSWISHPASCLRGCFWPASGHFCSVAFGPEEDPVLPCCCVAAPPPAAPPLDSGSSPARWQGSFRRPAQARRPRSSNDASLFHYDVSSEVLWFPLSVTKHDAGCSSLPFGCRSNPASTFRNCAHRRAFDLCRRIVRDPGAVQRDADNVNWASNSTLDDGSDFYLANRGNNSIVRVHQDGSVVTIRRVMLDDRPLDDARLTALPPLWRDDLCDFHG